jgi:hypothetical protein
MLLLKIHGELLNVIEKMQNSILKGAKNNMDWSQVLTVLVIIATNLGTVIALHIQTDNKIAAIHKEMQDFHGRLCAIEERNK